MVSVKRLFLGVLGRTLDYVTVMQWQCTVLYCTVCIRNETSALSGFYLHLDMFYLVDEYAFRGLFVLLPHRLDEPNVLESFPQAGNDPQARGGLTYMLPETVRTPANAARPAETYRTHDETTIACSRTLELESRKNAKKHKRNLFVYIYIYLTAVPPILQISTWAQCRAQHMGFTGRRLP